MKIGLTYDLKDDYLKQGFSKEETAEFDSIETIIAIESAINKLGYRTERIGNIKKLSQQLAEGKRWDLVFNICEGMYGIGREAQVPALLEAYDIPYVFSDTVTLALTLHKGYTKNIIRDNDIPTAEFKIIQKIEDIKDVNFAFPMFAKPVAEGTGKGITGKSIILNMHDLKKQCTLLLNKFNQPVLVEKFLSGREFTVGIVGTGDNAKVVGVMEIIVSNEEDIIYSYENKSNYEKTCTYALADEETAKICSDVALSAWNALNCRDGGRIDLKMDENNVPNFLEVNPLAGLHPVDSDLPIMAAKKGIPYTKLIETIVKSSIERNFGGSWDEYKIRNLAASGN